MIAAIQIELAENARRNPVRVVTEFGADADFVVPVNYVDETGFHFLAADPRDAVEMFDFSKAVH